MYRSVSKVITISRQKIKLKEFFFFTKREKFFNCIDNETAI